MRLVFGSLFFLMLSLAATAQEARVSDSFSAEVRPSPPKITIDFQGGTIGEYVDAVKKEADSLNLIVTEVAKGLVLPKIALKNVPVAVAINCIEQCFDTNETVVRVTDVNEGVQIIQAEVTNRNKVDVINVKHLFSDKKLNEETLLSAVEIGLEMYTKSDKTDLQIKFHQETGLLFLSGDQREIQLVQQIVSQLQGGIHYGSGMMESGGGAMMGGGLSMEMGGGMPGGGRMLSGSGGMGAGGGSGMRMGGGMSAGGSGMGTGLRPNGRGKPNGQRQNPFGGGSPGFGADEPAFNQSGLDAGFSSGGGSGAASGGTRQPKPVNRNKKSGGSGGGLAPAKRTGAGSGGGDAGGGASSVPGAAGGRSKGAFGQ